jgi:hypothetical protein
MADAETTTSTTETPHEPAPGSRQTAPTATQVSPRGRTMEVRSIKHGSVVATAEPSAPTEQRTVRSSTEPPARTFTEHQRKMLENLDKHGDVRGAAEPTTLQTSEGDKKPEPKPEVKAETKPEPKVDDKAPDKPAEKPVETSKDEPKVESKPTPDPELTAKLERLTEHNKKLVAELETRKAKPEPDKRTKALDEIERGLTTDSIGSLRKLVALNAGIEDPTSAEVDSIMSGIYAEWTARELKLQMDPAQEAKLGTVRNRLLIERDKRDREAKEKEASERTALEQETQRYQKVGSDLTKHLEGSKHADKFPLLMKHAQTIDRMSPGDLLFQSIRHGINAGEFPKDTPDSTLIDHYSKAIEAHYQALRDQLAEAKTSTAAPTQATVPSTENKADAPNTGARTITNASASVAPPAQPAATSPAPDKKPEPKKWRNEDERRRQLAKHYFGDD